jgi:hypothetical protein
MTYVSSVIFYLFGMKPKQSDVASIAAAKKDPEPNYYNRADMNPGYPNNAASGLSSDNETLKIRF